MEINVGAGVTGTPIITLEPNEIATITFAERLARIAVIRLAAVDVNIWWTDDGSDPDPEVGHGWLIPAGGVGIEERDTRWSAADDSGMHTIVKVIASAAAQVRIYRGDSTSQ